MMSEKSPLSRGPCGWGRVYKGTEQLAGDFDDKMSFEK
jgi:hypothetical protein